MRARLRARMQAFIGRGIDRANPHDGQPVGAIHEFTYHKSCCRWAASFTRSTNQPPAPPLAMEYLTSVILVLVMILLCVTAGEDCSNARNKHFIAILAIGLGLV